MRSERWTHKWYQDTNQVKNRLQSLVAHHHFVWYCLPKGEVPETKQLNIGVIGIVTLQATVVSLFSRVNGQRQLNPG